MSGEFIDEVGAANSPEIESIWLTRTSIKPLWLAISIGVAFIGLFSFWPLMVAGAVSVVLITISWIGDSRTESDELPLT
jgi:hypothetical protein